MKHEVVISGIGGKFPDSYNFDVFKSKLLNGETLYRSDPDRGSNKDESPPSSGRIPDWRLFDSTFFGLPPKVTEYSDATKTLTLERSFEAILDSGMNPFEMRGKNVAVLVAMDTSEANTITYTSDKITGLEIIGHAKSMIANRLSFFLNFTGPSMEFDNAGTGGLLVLEQAAKMVMNGEAEAAVVAAANTFIFDSIDIEYKGLNFMSPDRNCYPFDERAQGLVRCEGVVAFFIQRAQDARRSYCTLSKAQTCYLSGEPGSYLSLSSGYEQFLNEFYEDANVDPKKLAYVEANSCSLHEFDAMELNTISNITKHRGSPLLIGSVAGNLGYAECVSGFMSIVKAIVALQTGVIPRTLNYSQPNSKVPGLINGTLQPVTSNTNLEGDLVAVTNIGLFGSVGHVLLKRNKEETPETKVLQDGLPRDGLHRLILFQARHEEGALDILNKVSEAPLDPEFVMLANNCFKTEIPSYICRGYAVLPHQGNTRVQSTQVFDPTKRPVWYIFSGMGSQWAGMGRDLLQFSVFAAAIDKCDKVLRPRGLDIRHIITADEPPLFDNILNCFVGIAAVQIGLVDILTTVGISPDGMIGHSVGELGCAYADGCFTAEQMILAAYARGKASLDSELIPGMMAAVGKSYQEMKDLVPDTVDIACHNSTSSCTLSGPTDDINNYVSELKNQGVFAKAVSAGGIAYHSRYIKAIGPRLLTYLKEAIPDPKPRSSKWISSSIPETEWNTDKAKVCSAEYHTNNLLSPVLFEEACHHLPKNAIAIEIAPRGLLQAILKRSMGPDNINVPLISNTVSSNVVSVLGSLGQLYLHNVDVDVNALYPAGRLYLHNVDVDVNALYPAGRYPVSVTTPGLGALVTWLHDTEHHATFVKRAGRDYYNAEDGTHKSRNTYPLKQHYIVGSKGFHKKLQHSNGNEMVVEVISFTPAYLEWKRSTVNGLVLVPLPTLLVYVENLNNKVSAEGNRTLAFQDVTIRKYIPADTLKQLVTVSLFNATGNFEISKTDEDSETSTNCMNGTINQVYSEVDSFNFESDQQVGKVADENTINASELYSQLAYFGLQLEDGCQLIEYISIGFKECTAVVRWTGDVTWFLNAILNVVMAFQMELQKKLLFPSSFRKLTVNFRLLKNMEKGEKVRVHYDQRCNRLVASGVLELIGLTLSPAPNSEPKPLTWYQSKLEPIVRSNLPDECDIEAMSVVEATADSDWIKDLRQLLREGKSTRPVILYTHKLSPRTVLPLLVKESYVDRIRTVFVMDEDAPYFQADTPFYKSQLKFGQPVNILSHKVWNRLGTFPVDIQPSVSTIDNILKIGESTKSIQFVGLNPKSISIVDNLLQDETYEEYQYLDYSGMEDGKKVMGVASYDPVSNSVTRDPILKWEAPDTWSLEDLATVPATYTLAYFSLLQVRLNSSHSVLIHLGMSLLGQALVNLCLNIGASVYVSVEDDNEAIDLQKQFPQLKSTNILILDRQELKTKLKTKTKGQGVDVVFNGHKGKHLQDAINVTGPHGVFFHLCDIKAEEKEYLGLAALFNNTSFRSLRLKSAMGASNEEKKRVKLAIHKGIQNNIIRPFKKKLFSSTQQIQAVRGTYVDMSHKSVIEVRPTHKLRLNSCDVKKQSIIIKGKTDFWLDLLEWIVDLGYSKILVLNSEGKIENHDRKRLNRLIEKNNTMLNLRSTDSLNTIESARHLLKDLSHASSVFSVFGIEQDENSEEMKNLDLASREVLPDLDQFVCLLGEGSAVSESREASGLPVISIQSRAPLQTPRHILPYLTTILHDKQYLETSFYLVEDNMISPATKNLVDFTQYLPSNQEEIISLGSEISGSVEFHEEVTLSPGYAHVSHCLLPVFIIPGLGSRNLQPLIRKLVYPAFCCSLPETVESVHDFSQELLTNIMRIQSSGPYSIVGESWSGPVALALSQMLEAKGHQVHLCLIEAAPSVVQQRVNALSEAFDRDIKKGIVTYEDKSSDEERTKVDTLTKALVQRAVNSLTSLLTSLSQHVPSSNPLQEQIALITLTSIEPEEFQPISKLSEKAPKFLCTEDMSHQQLISNPATAAFINEHVAFSWHPTCAQ